MKIFSQTQCVAALMALALAACGGSTEPAGCSICGTWYLRYEPVTGQRIPHEAGRSLILNSDHTFVQYYGTTPYGEGSYSGDATSLAFIYQPPSPGGGITDQTAVIKGDSITFPVNAYHAFAWIYER